MTMNLKDVKRNRMLKQRETLWKAERQAASDVIKLLDEDIGYSTVMNIIGNYFCINFLMWGQDKEAEEALEKAFDGEKGLRLWGNTNAELATIETWLARGKQWRVEETGDLMRLAVAAMEAIEEAGIEVVPLFKMASTGYQFTDDSQDRYSCTYRLEYEDVDTMMEAMGAVKKKGIQVDGEKCDYTDVKKDSPANVIRLFDKKKETSGQVSTVGPRSRASVGSVIRRIKSLRGKGAKDVANQRRIARILTNGSGGTNIHSLKPDSLLGTIEWIFGLPGGADTSGTAAECVAWAEFLREALPVAELEDMTDGVPLYLGPVLAMVKHGHHTLIETATAIHIGETQVLKTNRRVDYTPGVYSSLLDASTAPTADTDSLLGKVYKTFKHYEVPEDENEVFYLYEPSTSSWSDPEKNAVSLRGGTIMDGYSYVSTNGKALRGVTISRLLKASCQVIVEHKDNTLEEQMDAIFTKVKAMIGQ